LLVPAVELFQFREDRNVLFCEVIPQLFAQGRVVGKVEPFVVASGVDSGKNREEIFVGIELNGFGAMQPGQAEQRDGGEGKDLLQNV
jgi:hypothetical protein